MRLIEGADYFVRVIDLPVQIGGMVTPNDDGTYSVYLNARNTAARMAMSFDHEVGHIENDDFYNGKNIGEVEHF